MGTGTAGIGKRARSSGGSSSARRRLALPARARRDRLALALLIAAAAIPSCAAPGTDPAAPDPAPTSRAAGELATGVVLGRVLEVDRPRAGTIVQLARMDGLLRQSAADENGRYQIDDVPPGEYLLHAVDFEAVRAGAMTMKSRGISVAPGALVEADFVFGTGVRVHGQITGIPPGGGRVQIAIYRPGAPRLEGFPLSDRARQLRAAGYLAGMAIVAGAASYEIRDVEPGPHRLVVTIPPAPSTPLHETWAAPLHEAEIEVGATDLEHPIAIGGSGPP